LHEFVRPAVVCLLSKSLTTAFRKTIEGVIGGDLFARKSPVAMGCSEIESRLS